MNAHTHLSTAQGPYQGELATQNENVVPSNQVHGFAGAAAPGARVGLGVAGAGALAEQQRVHPDAELLQVRNFMRDTIYSFLCDRQHQPIDDSSRMKLREISKRLEVDLFNTSHTKEDYMNLDTLEFRLANLIKNRSSHIDIQQRLGNLSLSCSAPHGVHPFSHDEPGTEQQNEATHSPNQFSQNSTQ